MQDELPKRADAVVDQIAKWAAQGQSAPARVIGEAQPFREWTHYPQPEAIDKSSGWRFYYHAHPRNQRLSAEHGHFHIFVPGPEISDRPPELRYSHLIGLSVDPKGLPLRLFTTNCWVTDDIWQAAEALTPWLDKPALHHAAPRDVGMWIENLLVLYRDEIATLLRDRDRRMGKLVAGLRKSRLDDRRLRYPSQTAINLAQKLRSLNSDRIKKAA